MEAATGARAMTVLAVARPVPDDAARTAPAASTATRTAGVNVTSTTSTVVASHASFGRGLARCSHDRPAVPPRIGSGARLTVDHPGRLVIAVVAQAGDELVDAEDDRSAGAARERTTESRDLWGDQA